MLNGDQLALVLVAGVTFVATLSGVLVAAGLDGRRRQRATIQQVRRLLRIVGDTAREGAEWGSAVPKKRARAEAARREADGLIHEIEILVPDLPRRVHGVVEATVDVLEERHRVDMSPSRAIWTACWSAETALKGTLKSSLPVWLLLRRWRKAPLSQNMQEYMGQVEFDREMDEESYRLQLEDWERQKAELQAEKAAERELSQADVTPDDSANP